MGFAPWRWSTAFWRRIASGRTVGIDELLTSDDLPYQAEIA